MKPCANGRLRQSGDAANESTGIQAGNRFEETLAEAENPAGITGKVTVLPDENLPLASGLDHRSLADVQARVHPDGLRNAIILRFDDSPKCDPEAGKCIDDCEG